MSFVNKYRSTTIYGELKVQKYNTGNIAGLLDVSGNTILRGDCIINGNLSATDGTIDISGNLKVTGDISGNLTGNVTGTASNSSNSTIATDNTNASFYPTFVSATSGNLPLKVDSSGISYNPFTETLNVTNINGTILNNATTSTITTDSSNQSFFPTFVSATTGNLPLKVDAGITYNPFLNILSCDVSGNVTGNVTGNLTGTATNSSNSTIATDSSNQSFFPTFVSATTGNLPLKVDSGITYNPSSNLLTTTVSSVNVTAVPTASDFRVPFLSANTGSATISSDSGILYNPSNNRLTVGQLELTSTPLLSSYVGGVWLVSDGTVDVFYPITTSQTDLADVCSQSTLSSYVKQDAGLGSGGIFSAVDFNDKINRVIVYPKWGIIAYANTSYNGTLLINYRNSYDFPVCVSAATADTMSSCKIYLDSVLQ